MSGNEGISDALMQSEVDSMLRLVESDRDRILVQLLWETGARIQEVSQLRAADFRRDDYAVRLQTMKRHSDKNGRKPVIYRWIVIKPKLFEDIQNYLRFHGIEDTSPLFAGRTKVGRVSIRHLRRIWYGYAKAAGVERLSLRTGLQGPAWPHLARHGHATHLLSHGVDVSMVQKRLGHSQIANTLIYLTIVTKDQARALENVEMYGNVRE